ncbi:gamma-glutamyltransferase [Cytophagaceae bacterium ABcell3]|nr:gamma-glutamyltransferase [Cytophagaceae bacterium ABcell3]
MGFLKLKSYIFLFCATLLLSCAHSDLSEEGTVGEKAMVVTAHPLASQVGVEILKTGGNAFDAAIAVEFALAVVYPDAGNIGGGGFWVIRTKDGETNALDYREVAPAAASRDMFLDEEGEPISEESHRGHLSAGVPGTVDGMVNAHRKYGSKPWEELLQPAIDLALHGFPLTKKEAKKLNRYMDDLEEYSTVRPEHMLNDRWRAGDTLVLEELGMTLALIRNYGRAGFYEGVTARNLIAEMERGGGIISLEDLDSYRSVWRKPVAGKYKDCKIISMPPPSAGGTGLLQLLKITEGYPLAKWGWNSTQSIHLMTEACRRVYADRSRHLGDPDFWDIPLDGLIDDDYLKGRMADFSMGQATDSDEVYAGEPFFAESHSTTHYSIVDPEGNAVAGTTTLNSIYGSRVVVAGSGFLLNNQMADFSLKPGHPDIYGLVEGEANAIAPGKRMLSSMTPTIVEKDNQLFMVLGSPGGSTIITTVYQTILNVTTFDFPMQGAVNAERFHHQWRPNWILAEWGSMRFSSVFELLAKGHRIAPAIEGLGRVDAVLVRPDNTLEGGADPRGDDKAEGF